VRVDNGGGIDDSDFESREIRLWLAVTKRQQIFNRVQYKNYAIKRRKISRENFAARKF
jgi:hypothetical protein